MKAIIIYVCTMFFFCSCSAQKIKIYNSCEQNKTLDSLQYVTFPNDNYSFSGNNVFKSIVKQKLTINNCLIEKIKDTSNSNIRIADSFNYTIGDVAFLLLPYTSTSKKIDVRKIMLEEFKEYSHNGEQNILFESLFYDVLHRNSTTKNYENRLRLYRKVKKSFK